MIELWEWCGSYTGEQDFLSEEEPSLALEVQCYLFIVCL